MAVGIPVFVFAQTFHGLGFFRGIKSQQGTGDSYLNNPNHVRIVDGGSLTLPAAYTAAVLWVQNGATVTINDTSTINTIIVSGNSTLNVNVELTTQKFYCISGTVTSAAYANTYSDATTWSTAPAAGNGHLVINANTATFVGPTCTIHMDGKGYAAGLTTKTQGGSPRINGTGGPGTSSTAGNGGGGGGHANNTPAGGSYATFGQSYYSYVGTLYGLEDSSPANGVSDYIDNLYLGSGGGSRADSYVGGAGGGAIKITTPSLAITTGGQINSKGACGVNYAGCGSGGTVYLNVTGAGGYSNVGAVSVAGGNNNPGYRPAGGYGRVYVNPTGLIDGSNNIAVGMVDGMDLQIPNGQTINTLTIGLATGSTGTVFWHPLGDAESGYTLSTLTIAAKGILSAYPHDRLVTDSTTWTTTAANGNGQLKIQATTVTVNGAIVMDGYGYPGGTPAKTQGGSPRINGTGGPGTSSTASNGGGGGGAAAAVPAGGSYATFGQSFYAYVGTLYGLEDSSPANGVSDYIDNLYLGSGGGGRGDGYFGAAGGGAIKVTASTLSVSSTGSITSKGVCPNTYYAGCGSGGTVYLNVTSAGGYSNTGVISASGANASPGYMPASGYGRVYVNPTGLLDGSNNIAVGMVDGMDLQIPNGQTINTLTIGLATGSTGTVFWHPLGDAESGYTLSTLTIAAKGILSAYPHDRLVTDSTTWTTAAANGNGQLKIQATTVTVNGAIVMDGYGYPGGTPAKTQGGAPRIGSVGGPGTSSTAGNGGGGGGAAAAQPGGASYGSLGGGGTGLVGELYGAADYTTQLYLGSGGGGRGDGYFGSAGGGAIKVTASTMTIASTGSVTAKAASPTTYYVGCGSGGTIYLNITTTSGLSSSGVVSVAGIDPSPGYMTAGGAGRLTVNLDAIKDGSGNISTGSLDGLDLRPANGYAIETLTIGITTGSVTTVYWNPQGSYTINNVVINTKGKLAAIPFDGLYSGGAWTNTPGQGNGKLLLDVTTSVTVNGYISADSAGYPGGTASKSQGGSLLGPGTTATTPNGGGGGGTTNANNTAAGGSFGTFGVHGSTTAQTGNLYGLGDGDSDNIPDYADDLYLGSGGGGNTANLTTGGRGGGAIKITTPAMTVASTGQITATGGAGSNYTGSGSGGTIYLDVTNAAGLSNSGWISVAGGTASYTASGGYGRIYVNSSAITSGSNITTGAIDGLDLVIPDTASISALSVGATTGSYARVFWRPLGSYTLGTLTVAAKGILSAWPFDRLETNSTTWTNAPSTSNGQLIIAADTSATINGYVNMDGYGYPGGRNGKSQGGSLLGPGTTATTPNGGGGGGSTSTNNPAASASYGTFGVHAAGTGQAGSIYGLEDTSPANGTADYIDNLYLGSGGGSNSGNSNNSVPGGGAIKITTPALTIASTGQITSYGGGAYNATIARFSEAPYLGAGSGGTIVLDVTNSGGFSNSGWLSVAGGSGSYVATGGYGRIYINPTGLINGSNNITTGAVDGLDLVIPDSTTINALTVGATTGSYTRVFWRPLGTYTLDTLTVAAKGILSAYPFDRLETNSTTWTNAPSTSNGQLIITADSSVTVNGYVNMDGYGYPGGRSGKSQGGSPDGPGVTAQTPNGGGGSGSTSTNNPAAGASYGTFGVHAAGTGIAGKLYGLSDYTTQLYLGSGGGSNSGNNNNGTPGGGAIKITTPAITIASTGQITAYGGGAYNAAIAKFSEAPYLGGGSGGTIVLDVTNNGGFSNSGWMSVAGGGGSYVAAGGYGRIYINPVGLMNGSNITTGAVDGLDLNLAESDSVTTLTIGSTTGSNARIFWRPPSMYSLTNVTVNTKGILSAWPFDRLETNSTTWTNAPSSSNGKLIMKASGTITVNGFVKMDGYGYPGGRSGKTQGGSPSGPGTTSTAANGGGGGGTASTNNQAASGGYGAAGGNGGGGAIAGTVYGASDFHTALYLGSGGGSNSGNDNNASPGGGAIDLQASAITIASGASVTAIGGGAYNVATAKFSEAPYTGGGSGGSIVFTGTVTNSGTISVAGGTGSYTTAGGVGRIGYRKFFYYTGSNQTFTVPSGVSAIWVKLWGAGGGGMSNSDYYGGGGGFVKHTSLSVTPAESLDVLVGGGGVWRTSSSPGGYGGGGSGSNNASWLWSGSGGGRSALRRSGADILTAGGGGAAGYPGVGGVTGAGGGGCSGTSGAGGDASGDPSYAQGLGGGLAAGGTGGTGDVNGKNGSQYQGGNGLNSTDGAGGMATSGGAGGGYYGGGSGGWVMNDASGAGGGGSCYVNGGSYEGASGPSPGGTTDPDFPDMYDAGYPIGYSPTDSDNSDGNPGMVVISW